MVIQISKTILKEIASIEDKMEKGLDNARREREQKISQADQDALNFLISEKNKLIKEFDTKLALEQEELAREKENIQLKGQKEVDKTTKAANKKKAADYILKIFEQKVN